MSDFLDGVRLLGRGIRHIASRPKRLLLGLLPALLSLIVFTALFIALFAYLGDLIHLIAGRGDGAAQTTAEVLLGAAIVSVALLLSIFAFTAVTLAIGNPFYEAIANDVEQELGGVTGEVATTWQRALLRSLLESALLIAVMVLLAVPIFLIGLIPLIGQLIAAVLGVLIGGWFLALELSAGPLARRGLRLRDRRRLLRAHRKTAFGFGIAAFVFFLIPLGAIVIMPAAVAGGTLLARKLLGLPTTAVPLPR